ncbi:hypothetical protein PCC8801_0473 [Rippkaea orientalis PCC 8801]|uniref:DUF4435 domain-containing protein n=1 Tax=Rippkaea orientalis (strain PCC 8801 / RF-1) TaxID=41431 RepID=B7JVJ8_RIPO1|nr:hypothetical protein [Rippkaea orientalis]ACK64569.1 hypothetical protein PCC8801_0473 [Rippkaea orientalis PCC 8801]
MPVNVLYCEGGKNTPDSRVLSNLLLGLEPKVRVRPVRTKYGLDRLIIFLKQEKNFGSNVTVAALKDRDFDRDDSSPQASPREWFAKDNDQTIQVGWSWERKEIENYLVDPEVVQRALGSKAPPIDDYRSALEESAKAITDYTAARIALSLAQPSSLSLKNYWGNHGINKKHLFPEHLLESDCRDAIKNIVSEVEQSQTIQEDCVLETFDQLILTCRIGGCRFQDFLTFFSGKDLLYGMKTSLAEFSLGEPTAFLERVVKGIEDSSDVWSWLPEWNQLRQVVQQFSL